MTNSPTLNSAATAGTSWSNPPSPPYSGTVTLPTVAVGDYIYVALQGTGGFPNITAASGAGATFTLRGSVSTGAGYLSVFAGVATAGGTNVGITATFTASSSGSGMLYAAAFSGATGFDGNAINPTCLGNNTSSQTVVEKTDSRWTTAVFIGGTSGSTLSAFTPLADVVMDALGNDGTSYIGGGHFPLSVAQGTGITVGATSTGGSNLFNDALVGSPPATEPPALNGNVGTGVASNASTVVASSITTNAAAVLFAAVGADGVVTVSSISSTSGLTWTKRAQKNTTRGAPNNDDTELWWAYAPAAVTNEVVTATLSNATYDNAGIVVWAMTGVQNTAAPFDPDSALPAWDFSTTTAPSVTWSSSRGSGAAIAINVTRDNGTNPASPSSFGWTQLGRAYAHGATYFCTVDVYWNVYADLVATSTDEFQISSTAGQLTLIDVVTAAGLSPPTNLRATAETTTSISMAWDASAGVAPITYDLRWKPSSESTWTVITGLSATSYDLTGLVAGTSYDFQVRAEDGSGGITAYTATVTASTTGLPVPAPIQSPNLQRYRGVVGVNWNGLTLIGDAFSGVVGQASFDTFAEYGNPMIGRITTPPIHSGRKRVFIDAFEIDIETGVGLPSGQGENPQWMLEWSRDGGRTWSSLQLWRSMGRIGEYLTRLRWLKLGQGRQWLLRLTSSDPVRRVIIGTYVDDHEGMG